MCYGLAMLTLSLFLQLPTLLIFPYKWMFWVMIKSVHLVESVPYAVIHEVSISRFELILFVLLTFALVATLFEKRKRSLFTASICAFLLFSSFAMHWNHVRTKRSITFYSINHHTAVSVQQAKSGFLFADEALLNNEGKMLFHIYHHIWASGADYETLNISETKSTGIVEMDNHCMDVLGQRLVIVNQPKDTTKLLLKPDFVLVAGSVLPPHRIPQKAHIVLQSGLAKHVQNAWAMQTNVHDLSNGYVQFDLKKSD